MLMTTGMLFSFFVQLLQYHGLKDKNPKNVAALLKVNPFFLKDYDVALRNYPMKKVSKIVTLLREIDVKSKGVGANSLPQHELLKEMLVDEANIVLVDITTVFNDTIYVLNRARTGLGSMAKQVVGSVIPSQVTPGPSSNVIGVRPYSGREQYPSSSLDG